MKKQKKKPKKNRALEKSWNDLLYWYNFERKKKKYKHYKKN